MGVAELVPPFSDLAGLSQQAIHGAGRAQIGAFIQEGGIDLSGGLVNEALTVEGSQHLLAFPDFQGPGRLRPGDYLVIRPRVAPAIESGSTQAQGLTGGSNAQFGSYLSGRGYQSSSPGSA